MPKIPRFRLATMLLLVALFALGLGWWQDWHRRNAPLYLHIFVPQNHSVEAPAPAKCVATMLIPSHGLIDIRHSYDNYSGQVTCSPLGQYHLDLQTNRRSSFSYTGPVKIDEITKPQGFIISGSVQIQLFALSRNKDGQTLLNNPDISEAEKQSLFIF